MKFAILRESLFSPMHLICYDWDINVVNSKTINIPECLWTSYLIKKYIAYFPTLSLDLNGAKEIIFRVFYTFWIYMDKTHYLEHSLNVIHDDFVLSFKF